MKEISCDLPYSEDLMKILDKEMDETGVIYFDTDQESFVEVMPVVKKSFIDEVNPVVSVVISLSSQVAVGLFVNWLYEKLKGLKGKVRIGNKNVDIDKAELTAAISEYNHE